MPYPRLSAFNRHVRNILWSSLLMFCPLATALAADGTSTASLVIDYTAPPHAQEIVRLDFYSFRHLSPIPDQWSEDLSNVALSKKTLVDSLTTSISARSGASPDKTILPIEAKSTKELLALSRQLDLQDLGETENLTYQTGSDVPKGPWRTIPLVDPDVLFRMANSGLLEASADGEFVTINSIFHDPLKDISRALAKYQKAATIFEKREAFTRLYHVAQKYNPVEKAFLHALGSISFKSPTIFNARERPIEIAEHKSRKFRSIWIEFPVNVELKQTRPLSEIVVEFELPHNYEVLDLFPIFLGIEDKETFESKGSVTGGAKSQLGSIVITELASRRIEIRNIRPRIEGGNVGENKLRWKLKNDAVREGTHRFIGIIGVPHGEPSRFSVRFSAHVEVATRSFSELISGTVTRGGTENNVVLIEY